MCKRSCISLTNTHKKALKFLTDFVFRCAKYWELLVEQNKVLHLIFEKVYYRDEKHSKKKDIYSISRQPLFEPCEVSSENPW